MVLTVGMERNFL